MTVNCFQTRRLHCSLLMKIVHITQHLSCEELAICPAGEKCGSTDKADSSALPFRTRAKSGES